MGNKSKQNGRVRPKPVETEERPEAIRFQVDNDKIILRLRQENEELRHQLLLASIALEELPALRKQFDELSALITANEERVEAPSTNGKKKKVNA